MYQIFYRCVYRDFWYLGPEVDDWNMAVATACQIKAQRNTPVMIQDDQGRTYTL